MMRIAFEYVIIDNTRIDLLMRRVYYQHGILTTLAYIVRKGVLPVWFWSWFGHGSRKQNKDPLTSAVASAT